MGGQEQYHRRSGSGIMGGLRVIISSASNGQSWLESPGGSVKSRREVDVFKGPQLFDTRSQVYNTVWQLLLFRAIRGKLCLHILLLGLV